MIFGDTDPPSLKLGVADEEIIWFESLWTADCSDETIFMRM